MAVPQFFSAFTRWLAPIALVALVSACGPSAPTFQGSDISGTDIGHGLALTDDNGQPRTLKDYDGKVKLVFFGYTQCPDVCPTSLAGLSDVMKKLGSDADQVQVLMISVDPERDTQAVLKQYVTAFDPRFMGLRGTDEQTKQAAQSFKAYYARGDATDGKNYGVDHSSVFYLMDRKGQPRVLASNTIGTDALVHDIRALLN
jgi:protein SCO1/2